MQCLRLPVQGCTKNLSHKVVRSAIAKFPAVSPTSGRTTPTMPAKLGTRLTQSLPLHKPIRRFHTEAPNSPHSVSTRHFFIFLRPRMTTRQAWKVQETIERAISEHSYAKKMPPFAKEPQVLSRSRFIPFGLRAIQISLRLPPYKTWPFSMLHELNKIRNVSLALHYYTDAQLQRLVSQLRSRETDIGKICEAIISTPDGKVRQLFVARKRLTEKDMGPVSRMLDDMDVSIDVEEVPDNPYGLSNAPSPVHIITLPSDRLDASVALQQCEEFISCDDANVANLAKALRCDLSHAHAVWMELFGKDH